MTMTDTSTGVRTARSQARRGVLRGLLLGGLVWGAYLVQAATVDVFSSWDTSVIPALAVVVVAALFLAMLRPTMRVLGAGVALGAFLTLPLVLGAFIALFAALNLE